MNLKGKNQINKDFNFSSITDIVFLLLIFFMIASSLAKSHDTIEVKLPNAKGKTENKNSISVTIDRNINFFLNGVIVQKSQIEKEILGILTKENRSIILKSEKTVPIQDVIYVMNIANKNSINIVLAVDARESE
ncbi:MAG: biopolymer transporter ExbD [Bacteroidota bacterium]|nr:biopolymer transporter ExbD [Flavobacteriaceae bacterium]MEC7870366.1 biopolymer transporter ExbD [Bacteroidota bacterium]MEC8615840.1 biopolymer transporter ExbD [Bacteroidota bacterium]|tara:strand:- start:740 stop:1141 length:402 start_codon:yes stop_codon:yes gene_type:complete